MVFLPLTFAGIARRRGRRGRWGDFCHWNEAALKAICCHFLLFSPSAAQMPRTRRQTGMHVELRLARQHWRQLRLKQWWANWSRPVENGTDGQQQQMDVPRQRSKTCKYPQGSILIKSKILPSCFLTSRVPDHKLWGKIIHSPKMEWFLWTYNLLKDKQTEKLELI